MNKFVITLAKIVRFLVRPFFPVKVYGFKNIPNKKCLVVSNHLSGWDPIIFTLRNKEIIPFVYKAEFRKSAFLRWAFDGMDCIPVKRGEVDLTATKSILRLLKDGKAVYLYPEGTRNPQVDCLQEFHTGAALFALKTHSPVRPVYIWDKHKAFRRNYIIIGEEFTLDEFYDLPISRKILEDATAVIKDSVDKLRVELNAILAAKGVKRRKRTKKEIEKIEKYNERQRTLAKELAAKQAAEAALSEQQPSDRQSTQGE